MLNEDDENRLDREEWMREIADRMLEPYGKECPPGTLLSRSPIDLSKPNQHDSKAEFLAELDATSRSLQAIEGFLDSFAVRGDDPDKLAVLKRLWKNVDGKLRANKAKPPISDASDLVRNNVADAGASGTATMVFLDLFMALTERRHELLEQQKLYWDLPHRAPDYYARTIALRLAKLFSTQTGKRPTVGTSGETGEPSTDYARALAETFELLGISAKSRGHAEWAIEQLTEEDLIAPMENVLRRYATATSTEKAETLKRLKKGPPN